MPRFAFQIEYDGGPFQGWQLQASGPSVQGALESALAQIEPEPVRVHAGGRTDAGVHALGQVAHADLSRTWDPFRLTEAINAHLRPLPVVVLACAKVPETFHARFSAVGRRYLYRILNRRAPPALDAGRVWHVRHPLDVTAMREAARALIGRHDFTTFRASLCQARSPVKTLDAIEIEPLADEIRFSFAARSFLHHQVRSIVGTLERVGAGAWPPERVATALAARDRAACGPVAPAHGLYLTAVVYDPDPFAKSKGPG